MSFLIGIKLTNKSSKIESSCLYRVLLILCIHIRGFLYGLMRILWEIFRLFYLEIIRVVLILLLEILSESLLFCHLLKELYFSFFFFQSFSQQHSFCLKLPDDNLIDSLHHSSILVVKFLFQDWVCAYHFYCSSFLLYYENLSYINNRFYFLLTSKKYYINKSSFLIRDQK